jgi:hypothetical protein
MDVGAWLRGLRLGQYEATFRESEIDAEVLPDLTEGDLEKIGVPLGHRKRLLKAIAAQRTISPDPRALPLLVRHQRPAAFAGKRRVCFLLAARSSRNHQNSPICRPAA